MKMLQAQPALSVKDMARSIGFYRDKLGLSFVLETEGFAIFRRDAVELHLWLANDESWRTREDTRPVTSGAESFLAGTGSCRIFVEGVEELFRTLQPLGIIHGNAPLTDQPWGDRDFAVQDPDGNLVTFFEGLPG